MVEILVQDVGAGSDLDALAGGLREGVLLSAGA